jgi:hypothetical protein
MYQDKVALYIYIYIYSLMIGYNPTFKCLQIIYKFLNSFLYKYLERSINGLLISENLDNI